MAVHGTDANRSRDRTRLTGRLQGRSPSDVTRHARAGDNVQCGETPTAEACASRPSTDRSVLVLAPHGTSRAGVADGTCLIHGAERQRMVDATEQAIDLDGGRAAGNDGDMADAAPSDPTRSRDRSAWVAPLDRVQRHGCVPFPGVLRCASELSLMICASCQQWRVRTTPPHPAARRRWGPQHVRLTRSRCRSPGASEEWPCSDDASARRP